jgi:anti-sigma factor ChrR (cupin superfamily)
MNTQTDSLPVDWAARLALLLKPVHPPAERAADLRTRILERARAGKASAPRQDPHLTLRAGEGRWNELAPGIEVKPLRGDADTVSYLLRMAAGMRIPAHDHLEDEECMVLAGDVWLGDTHAFAGDYHLARRGIPHGEVRTDTGCLLFLRGAKPETVRPRA